MERRLIHYFLNGVDVFFLLFFVDIKIQLCYNMSKCKPVGFRHNKERDTVIEVTRLKGSTVIINAELIEMIEETPDTVITLTSGKKYIVGETGQEIMNLVIDYKRKIQSLQ